MNPMTDAFRMRRRSRMLARVALIICAYGAASHAAQPEAESTQGYPVKPVRIVVPFAPGGGTDTIARILALKLTEALGQAVIVDNRPGAGGTIGADLVAKSAADGYTLLFGSPGPISVNPHLQANIPYQALRDFAPVTQVSTSPLVLVLNQSVPAGSVKELIALARAQPGQLNYGSAGNGAVEHLGAELFKFLTGVNLVHVPYKGTGPALTDLLGGQIQMLFENMPPVLPHIKSGKLKALGVGAVKRSSFLPDTPTIIEAGVPGYEASSWFGILVPAATPRRVVGILNAASVKLLQSRDVKDRLAAIGAEPVGNTPEEFGAYLKAKLVEIGRIVKAADMKME